MSHSCRQIATASDDRENQGSRKEGPLAESLREVLRLLGSPRYGYGQVSAGAKIACALAALGLSAVFVDSFLIATAGNEPLFESLPWYAEGFLLFLWSTVVFTLLGLLVGRLFGGTLNSGKAALVVLASAVPALALYFVEWLAPTDTLFESWGDEPLRRSEESVLMALSFLLPLAYTIWYESGVYAEALPIQRGRAIIAVLVGGMVLAIGVPLMVIVFSEPQSEPLTPVDVVYDGALQIRAESFIDTE